MTQIVSPPPEDDNSSKEEPSSTVEEIETKSFIEQGIEEIQREPAEGAKIHFYNPQICFFFAFPHILFCYKDCVYLYLCVFSRGYASQTSASTERFTKYGKG